VVRNMGEFFDILFHTENEQGKIFLTVLKNEAEKKCFEKFRKKPFKPKHILALRDDLAGVMADRLDRISDDKLHALVLHRAHQFLEEIGDISATKGVYCGPQGTDCNITELEIAEASGILRFTDDQVLEDIDD